MFYTALRALWTVNARIKKWSVFLTKIIFEAIFEVDHGEESTWVRCHLKEHILVHNPTKGQFKIPILSGKKWRRKHEHSHYLETALTLCIHLAQANSWQHMKSIGVWNFSLARRATYSLHRHSRARPFCCVFDTLSPLRTLLLFFQFHAFSDVCKQTGGSIYMILPVCYYSSDQSHSKNMRIIKTHLDKHW